jgi:hypothetical protein
MTAVPDYLAVPCIRCGERIRVNTGRGYCKECRKRVFGGRLESDALNREYARNSRLIEKLCNKYHYYSNGYSAAIPAISELFKRQDQITKEIEECTGVHIPTEEELEQDAKIHRERQEEWYNEFSAEMDKEEEEERTKTREREHKERLDERLRRGNVPGQTKLFVDEDKK